MCEFVGLILNSLHCSPSIKARFSTLTRQPVSDNNLFMSLPVTTDIVHGDCREALRRFEDGTFDLIVTSPPYADQRNKTYGGIKPEKYVEWFLARSEQFLRVMKPTGSFVLNIKEKAEAGSGMFMSWN